MCVSVREDGLFHARIRLPRRGSCPFRSDQLATFLSQLVDIADSVPSPPPRQSRVPQESAKRCLAADVSPQILDLPDLFPPDSLFRGPPCLSPRILQAGLRFVVMILSDSSLCNFLSSRQFLNRLSSFRPCPSDSELSLRGIRLRFRYWKRPCSSTSSFTFPSPVVDDHCSWPFTSIHKQAFRPLSLTSSSACNSVFGDVRAKASVTIFPPRRLAPPLSLRGYSLNLRGFLSPPPFFFLILCLNFLSCLPPFSSSWRRWLLPSTMRSVKIGRAR